MIAKDMDTWLSSRRVWGTPRVYSNPANMTLKNGVLSQTGFEPPITGHIEYVFKGYDGHGNSHGGAIGYYNEGAITKLWKCGR